MQAISFQLNGIQRKVITDPQRKLVEVIRQDLKLTGTKEGCGTGHCGTCTVLLDDQAVLACKTPVIKVRGRSVTTIEGLGTPDHPHPLQSAFAKAGAIQCGFCTPGLILRSQALLVKNPHPSRSEIQSALQPHLCRCTGYQKVFEAVELAAAVLRGEAGPDLPPNGRGPHRKAGGPDRCPAKSHRHGPLRRRYRRGRLLLHESFEESSFACPDS